MRKKINTQQTFGFNSFCISKKIERDFQEKYVKISNSLDSCPQILDLVHSDLENFGNSQTRSSKYSSETILRILIVMFIEQLSLRKVCLRISDSMLLRDFIRIGIDNIPEHTFLCRAKNAIQESTMRKINDLFLQYCVTEGKVTGDSLRIDSTAVESNIHYPTDSSLLLDGYRKLEQIIKRHNRRSETQISVRFHTKKMKKLVQNIARLSGTKSESSKRKIKEYYQLIIPRVENVCLKVIDFAEENPRYKKSLMFYVNLVNSVIEQSIRRVLNGKSVPNDEKIFSVYESHTELIRRGKPGKPVEFGHKVTIAQTEQRLITHYEVDYYQKSDTKHLDNALKSHKNVFEKYPTMIACDKGYWENETAYQELQKKIKVVGIPKKGKGNTIQSNRENSEEFKVAQRFRSGIEGSIGVLKNCFKMFRCMWKGYKNFVGWVSFSIFCHNLVVLD